MMMGSTGALANSCSTRVIRHLQTGSIKFHSNLGAKIKFSFSH